jgi:F-type H+-transporting ATPase subunit b
MPQLDTLQWPPQLFWLAVCFLTLYFIIQRLVIPGVGGTIAKREQRITSDLAAAQDFKAETDAAVKAYEAALAAARDKAHAITREAQATLDAGMQARSHKLDGEMGGKIAAAEKSIAAAKRKAMADIKIVAADIAKQIVGELTGARVTKADAAAAVAKAGK